MFCDNRQLSSVPGRKERESWGGGGGRFHGGEEEGNRKFLLGQSPRAKGEPMSFRKRKLADVSRGTGLDWVSAGGQTGPVG